MKKMKSFFIAYLHLFIYVNYCITCLRQLKLRMWRYSQFKLITVICLKWAILMFSLCQGNLIFSLYLYVYTVFVKTWFLFSPIITYLLFVLFHLNKKNISWPFLNSNSLQQRTSNFYRIFCVSVMKFFWHL